uniref:DUF5980 family protein n=1 Tax=Herbidospora sakaeratensis TaxID=564415 RepID=UPI0007818FE3|nr:DUF5980 family protein [Herbidospora sakaeratensis]
MKTIHRALTAGLLMALFAASAAPASAATWTLRDLQQRICVDAAYGRSTYFLVSVEGTWSSTIGATVQNLPPGSSTSGTSPIPPGSNYGGTVQTAVGVTIPPTPVGVYAAQLRATDGTDVQTVPLTVDVRSRC